LYANYLYTFFQCCRLCCRCFCNIDVYCTAYPGKQFNKGLLSYLQTTEHIVQIYYVLMTWVEQNSACKCVSVLDNVKIGMHFFLVICMQYQFLTRTTE
jgi:hypothetical protein